MSTRSTLDPIAEAEAQVRLRYMRGRRKRNPAPSIGLYAERLSRKKGGKKAPPLAHLKRNWRHIAGEKLFKYCHPLKITGGRDGRTLIIGCVPAASGLVEHSIETIRQRASVNAGGDIVAIKIDQTKPPKAAAPARPKPKARKLTPKERESLETQAASIESPGLRAAIVSLGTAVLTAKE